MVSSILFRHSSAESKRRRLEEEPASLDDLVGRLRRNEIVDLKLGWTHSNFLQGKRHVVALEKALKQNYSLDSVTIGWRHTHRDSLIKLLRAIAKYTPRLRHLKLVLDDWVPVSVLNDLLQRQQCLVTLDLQAVSVLSQKNGHWCCNPKSLRSSSQHPDRGAGHHHHHHHQGPLMVRRSWELEQQHLNNQENENPCCDHSVVTHCILQQYHHHKNLKVLALVECDLTDDKVICLADFLHIRGGIAELSLRSNRKLTGRGLKIICQAPVMKRLDLSLCDLEPPDVEAVARGIAARPWPVEELLLAGNYRMGSPGLLALTGASCCQKMVALNISYCDCKYYRSVMILNALARLDATTTLRRVMIHGMVVGNELVATALQQLLLSGTPLRSIQLNDPKDPKPMNAAQLRVVLKGVQQSYDLEELLIDSRHTPEEMQVWHEIDFTLRLNAAGRRILRSPPNEPRVYSGFPVQPVDDWFQVLEKAGNSDQAEHDDHLEVLFWIVREGADHFEQRERERQQQK